MARRQQVDWDAVADLDLPTLEAAQAADLHKRLDALAIDGLVAESLTAAGLDLRDCAVTACRAERARFRRSRLGTCLVAESAAGELDAADSAWIDVVVRGCRAGAVIAPGATLQRVTVTGSRIDYANLRGSTLERVQLIDCGIGELDVGGAALTDVRLVRCSVERLVLSDAVCVRVDVRGAEIGALEGLDGLRGAVITTDQLARLAPALADHLGLLVEDGAQAPTGRRDLAGTPPLTGGGPLTAR